MPTHTITILLGMTFCCMNPLLPMMALIYFLINSLTEKYNMMYVMRARFQSGGRVRSSRPVLKVSREALLHALQDGCGCPSFLLSISAHCM